MLLTPNEAFAVSASYIQPSTLSIQNVFGPGKSSAPSCNGKNNFWKNNSNTAQFTRIDPRFGRHRLTNSRVVTSRMFPGGMGPSQTICKKFCEVSQGSAPTSLAKTIHPCSISKVSVSGIGTARGNPSGWTTAGEQKEFSTNIGGEQEADMMVDKRKSELPVTILDTLNLSYKLRPPLSSVTKPPYSPPKEVPTGVGDIVIPWPPNLCLHPSPLETNNNINGMLIVNTVNVSYGQMR